MNLLDKFKVFEAIRTELQQHVKEAPSLPFRTVSDTLLSATEAVIAGQRTILAGTNNYLGLTFDPDCIHAAQQALHAYGTGTTGSRMANGTYAGHVALEQELAAFYQSPAAIIFSTGYMANLSMLAGLAGRDDVILLDADSHASLYDGCKLSEAEVIRFRHNDAEDVRKRLKRLGERASRSLIVVEGIYSMLGDSAPLAELVAVKREFGAYLLVDEAHSLGVLGLHGRGLAEAAGVEADVDFIVGTFSKSLGSIGGFCVSRWADLDLLRYAMRPYLFTAAASPASIASTRQALQTLVHRPALRQSLWANAEQLYHGLAALGFQVGPQCSPIIAVIRDSREQAVADWTSLLKQGIYVNLILPPGAPSGLSLLRCSVSAAHTHAQIARIIEAFAQLPSRRAGSR